MLKNFIEKNYFIFNKSLQSELVNFYIICKIATCILIVCQHTEAWLASPISNAWFAGILLYVAAKFPITYKIGYPK